MTGSPSSRSVQSAEAARALALALLESSAIMAPMLDAADGMRADLERRGWSPTMAEQLAGTWLQQALLRSWAS